VIALVDSMPTLPTLPYTACGRESGMNHCLAKIFQAIGPLRRLAMPTQPTSESCP
jgi:hypothetical protein